MEVLRRRCQGAGFALSDELLPWSCAYYLEHRRDDARGRDRHAARLRCDLPRRRGLARDGAGFGVAARAAAADPQGLRPICQHPPAPAACRRRGAAEGGRLRHPLHPREHRGRVFRRRRPGASGHGQRGGGRDLDLHPRGGRAHPPLRLRAGARAARQASDLGHEVERAEILDGVLGRGDRASWPPTIPTSTVSHYAYRRHGRPDGDGAARASTWSSPRTSSATS